MEHSHPRPVAAGSAGTPPSGPPLLVGSVAPVDEHDTGLGHPERPARLRAVDAGLAEVVRRGATSPLVGRDATTAELERVHDPAYLAALEELARIGGGSLDPDTPVAPGSWTTAVAAAGLGLAAIDALRAGRGEVAFVAPRPPGHHAGVRRGMGFCLLNNVAICAAALADAGERVLIVDWDVHHGNGTQEVFWDDPRVLYASVHQAGAYPGTGGADETGGPQALDATVNVPLPVGATGDVAAAAFDEVIWPAAARFAPSWILVSAGYDAHRDDPLADLAWSAGDFADLTRRAVELAPATGRTVLFLEGGYDLGALERSVAATAGALTGVVGTTEARTSGGPGRDRVRAVAEVRRRRLEVPDRWS